MNVWLVTIGEPLPIDGDGDDRLYRAGILATKLAQRGHQVSWWTSTFDHARKQQRFSSTTSIDLDSGITIKLLHGCGYPRSVSFKRLLDHAILARQFTQLTSDLTPPDVILCSLPPLELPVAVTEYGILNNVPVIVDVRDLWPDLFLELAPPWARFLMNISLYPMRRQARKACKNAYAITGNAPQFVDWGVKLASRSKSLLDKSFPHGYATKTPEQDKVDRAYKYWAKYGITQNDDSFVVCFFGAIGPQSELDTVINAARELEEQGGDFKFVLCGKGDHLETLKRKVENVSSVIFPGWVNAAEIWTLMRMSNVGLAVYRSNVGYVTNMPNKPIEYMSAGLPIVSSLSGYLESFLKEHKCGLTYPNGDVATLTKLLSGLVDNKEKLNTMSQNAQQVFEEYFDADKVYSDMISYLNDVILKYAEQ